MFGWALRYKKEEIFGCMPVRALVRTVQTCRKVQRMRTAILRNSEILVKYRNIYDRSSIV